MQQDIGSISQTMQQQVQRALAIRDEHLMLTRFRVTWDDVKIFEVSSVTAIRELLVTLNLSSSRIAMHTSLSHSVVSNHLRGVRNLTPTSVAELIRFLCATIAASRVACRKSRGTAGAKLSTCTHLPASRKPRLNCLKMTHKLFCSCLNKKKCCAWC